MDSRKNNIPKVSVLMPSYNVAKFYQECIESVINQKLKDIEILCIDAGSTDGTLELIREYESYDDRIRLVKADVKSYGYQMNLGIQMARGEYIAIVETDDYIHSHMLFDLSRIADSTHADFVKGWWSNVYESNDGRRIEKGNIAVPYRIRVNVPFSPLADVSIHLWDTNIWCGIYRLDFLKKNNISFSETAGAAYQDIGFKHRVLVYAQKIVYVDKLYYFYRCIRDGASTWNDRCLSNLCNEFKNLIDDSTINTYIKSYIYARVVSSFLTEYNKVFQLCNYDTDLLSENDYVKWFKKIARDQIDNNSGSRLWISSEMLSEVHLFLENEYIYGQRIKESLISLKLIQKKILSKLDKNGVVLYGCTTFGKKFLVFEHNNGVIPVAITDEHLGIWGKDIEYHEVVAPEKAISKYKNSLFVITDCDLGERIYERLINSGISAERIIIIDYSDKTFYNAVAKGYVLLNMGD